MRVLVDLIALGVLAALAWHGWAWWRQRRFTLAPILAAGSLLSVSAHVERHQAWWPSALGAVAWGGMTVMYLLEGRLRLPRWAGFRYVRNIEAAHLVAVDPAGGSTFQVDTSTLDLYWRRWRLASIQ